MWIKFVFIATSVRKSKRKNEVETFNNIRSLANEKQNPNLALFCLYGFLYMKMEKYLRVPADEDFKYLLV